MDRLVALGKKAIEMHALRYILDKIQDECKVWLVGHKLVKEEKAEKEQKSTKKQRRRQKMKGEDEQNILSVKEKGLEARLEEEGLDDTLEEEGAEGVEVATQDKVLKQLNRMCVFHKVLGSGSTSTVFEGTYCFRRVALKQILWASLDQPPVEIKSLIDLGKHPNLVTYHGCEWDHEKQFLYIALELCTCTLEELIIGDKEIGFDRKMLWEDGGYHFLMEIITGVINGIDHLHSRNVVHRDLTAHNILIKVSMETKHNRGVTLIPMISDFGTVKSLIPNEDLNGSPEFAILSNKRKWQTPERVESDKPRISYAMDLYFLGKIITFIMSKGQVPVNNLSDVEFYFKKEAPELAKLAGDLMDPNSDKRPSILEVKNHPIFWLVQKKMDFLVDAYYRIKSVTREPDLKGRIEGLAKGVGFEEDNVFQGKSSWYECLLDETLKNEVTKVRGGRKKKYDTSKVVDLLRFFRNKKCHITELEEMTDVDLFTKFDASFPSLLIEVYEIVKNHCKEENWVGRYF